MELSRRPIMQAIKSVIMRPAYQPVAPFLYPFLSQQTRNASILSDLRENPGHYNKKIRRGRGPASGKGKTSGRGHKGQGQHGKVPAGFNGGQTPDEVVSGSRGFENPWSIDLAPVNLDRIQAWIDLGRIDPRRPITLKELKVSRCVHQIKDGVKLLARGKGELTSKIHIITSRASEEAIAAVEAQGGTVTTRFYSKFAIKKIMKGEMDPMHSELSKIDEFPPVRQYKYRLPDPISRKELEYYRDHKKRGYLSHTVEDGHGPSLFFKNPFLRKPRDPAAKSSEKSDTPVAPKVVKRAEPKMW